VFLRLCPRILPTHEVGGDPTTAVPTLAGAGRTGVPTGSDRLSEFPSTSLTYGVCRHGNRWAALRDHVLSARFYKPTRPSTRTTPRHRFPRQADMQDRGSCQGILCSLVAPNNTPFSIVAFFAGSRSGGHRCSRRIPSLPHPAGIGGPWTTNPAGPEDRVTTGPVLAQRSSAQGPDISRTRASKRVRTY